jgi:hypothetical protein
MLKSLSSSERSSACRSDAAFLQCGVFTDASCKTARIVRSFNRSKEINTSDSNKADCGECILVLIVVANLNL